MVMLDGCPTQHADQLSAKTTATTGILSGIDRQVDRPLTGVTERAQLIGLVGHQRTLREVAVGAALKPPSILPSGIPTPYLP